MAHFTQAPTAAKAPEPAQTRPARLDKNASSPQPKTQTSAAPQASTPQADPVPKAEGPGSDAEPKDSKAASPNPDVDPKDAKKATLNTKVDPARSEAAPTSGAASGAGSSASAAVTSSLLPAGAIPVKAPTEDAPSPLPAVPAAMPMAPGQQLSAGTPATQPAGMLPDHPMTAPSPANPPQPGTLPPSGTDSPAVSGVVPSSENLPAKTEHSDQGQTPPVPQQADPLITSTNDSVHLKSQASIQAVIAELASRAKEASNSERTTPSGEVPSTEATPAMKLTRTAEVQVQTADPAETRAKPLAGTMSSDAALQNPAESSKPMAPSVVSLDATAPAPEALAVKPSTLPPLPVLHATDGSAVAVAGILPRAAETTPVPSPTAVPLPAAQPSATVVQVEGGLRWMLKGGVQEAQLQLHPDSLGQVTIHLKVVGNEVHARMWIREPGSVQAVQEGRPHLEMSLKEQGLQLGSFDLQQGQRPFQESPSTPSFREPSTSDPSTARQEAPAAPSMAILNPHHVELYA
jgi:flagellar hook-length control protein FliK